MGNYYKLRFRLKLLISHPLPLCLSLSLYINRVTNEKEAVPFIPVSSSRNDVAVRGIDMLSRLSEINYGCRQAYWHIGCYVCAAMRRHLGRVPSPDGLPGIAKRRRRPIRSEDHTFKLMPLD